MIMNLKKTAIALALSMPVLCVSTIPAQAAEATERLQQAEQRIRYLEQRVQAQDEAIAEQGSVKGQWFDAIEVSGAVEVEASYVDAEMADSESDIAAATVELAIAGDLNDTTSAEIVLLYEDGDSELDVDVAQFSYTLPNSALTLTAGQLYVPFGTYETALVSDPLTLELGETRETVLSLGFDQGGWLSSFYIFNGDNSEGGDNSIDNWGANIGYVNEVVALGLAYINDIGDSDALQETLESNEVVEYTAGVSVNASVSFGASTIIAEYTAASDAFAADVLGGAKPSATNLELNHVLPIAGKEGVLAFAYQTTDESLALELPENRILLGLGVDINDHFSVAAELSRDEDYAVQDGGSGTTTNALVIQLAAGF